MSEQDKEASAKQAAEFEADTSKAINRFAQYTAPCHAGDASICR